MKGLIVLAAGLVASVLIDHAVAQAPSSLLAIDQHRATVIDRIVTQWGERLAQSGTGLSAEQLRTMLAGLRAEPCWRRASRAHSMEFAMCLGLRSHPPRRRA